MSLNTGMKFCAVEGALPVRRKAVRNARLKLPVKSKPLPRKAARPYFYNPSARD